MKTHLNSLKLGATLAVALTSPLFASTFDNEGGDSTWENGLNWDNDIVAGGFDTIVIPSGFNVTRATELRLTNEEPGSLDIQSGGTLTINGDLQMDQSPASVNIAGSLIFASGGTKSNMENGLTQGTYTLSGLLRFNDYDNGIASSGGASGAPLLDFVQVGASMEALGMSAADFTNFDGKLTDPAFFFAINGTQINNTGTPSSSVGADVVGGLYLARTDTADSVTLTLTEAQGGETPTGPVAHFQFEEGEGNSTVDAISGESLLIDSATWEVPNGGLPGSTGGLDFSFALDPATRVDDTIGGFAGIAGSGDRTISAWVKTSDLGRSQMIGWGSSIGPDGGLGERASFLVINGALRFEIGGSFVVATTNIADGEWHHIAISTTGTDIDDTLFWVDGVPDAISDSLSTIPINSIAQWLTVGGANQPGAGQSRFQGSLDDLRVYDRVLTSSEIADLMNPGTDTGTLTLKVEGYHPETGVLSLSATGIPSGQTFHLESSAGLQDWDDLSSSFDFTSETPQPFEITIDQGAAPAMFYRIADGPSGQ